MNTTRSQRVWDIAERVVWTVIQGGAAESIVLTTGWSQAWTVPIMALLALVKTTLASKFATTSAATLPASLDAGAPGDSPAATGRHAAVEDELPPARPAQVQDVFANVPPSLIPAEVLAKSRHPSGKGFTPQDGPPSTPHRDYPA